MPRKFWALVLGFCALLVSGCGSMPVAQDLNQSQAQEIVAALTAQGIRAVASKETGGRGMYSVRIAEDQYGIAVRLLQERGLPSEARPTVSELLAPQGIIPSSREMEAMRLDYALASQVEEVIGNHPSVVRARCMVRLNFLSEGQEPAISLVIEERSKSTPLAPTEIVEIVRNAVPGVKKENIAIALGTLAHDPEADKNLEHLAPRVPLVSFLWFWQVPEGDYAGLALLFSGALLLVGGVAVGVGYWTCLYHRTKDSVETNVPEVLPRALRLDRLRKDLPE